MNMILPVHIIIALSSVAYTTLLFAHPSKNKFYVNYGLVTLTIASGTYLVISTHARILQACITGLVYVSIVTAGSAAAHYRLRLLNKI